MAGLDAEPAGAPAAGGLGAADWQREADRVAAAQYAPPGVLIDDHFDILQFRGPTGPYLAPAAGKPPHNLLTLAREGLAAALRSSIAECRRSGAAVRQPGVRVRSEGVEREVDLQVLPLTLPQTGARCTLVLFEEPSPRAAELAQLNDDMTNLLVSSGVAKVVLGPDLRIRRFTPAAGQLLGLVAADLGRPIVQLKTGVALPALAARVAEVVAGVRPQEHEVRGADGRAYLLRIHPYRTTDARIDGAVLVLFDIDELRRAQTGLRAERDYAQAIVETVRQPLLVLDKELRVRSANAAYYAKFQVAPQDTLDRLFPALGNGQWDIPALREQLAEIPSNDSQVTDFEVRDEFDPIGPKVMRLSARRIPRSDADSLILLTIEDFTEAALREEQTGRQLAEVVDIDRSKTAFLALLAHELRNPLAPIRNALQVLDRPEVDDDLARRMRAMIERQVKQIARLVDDLLDIARINTGQIEVRRQRLDLCELLRAAVDAARPSCAAKDIDLIATLPDGPLTLDADATRLSQVVGNLLNNACKFTDPGGRIVLALERRGDEAVVRVGDSGIGIAPDELPRVFDMFMQIDDSRARSHSGLGLGLTLVKRLVEAHGGTVSAHSAGLGRGSEFELHLPLPDAASGPPAPAEPVRAREPTRKRRILVVDDDHDGAESMALALAFHGHEVPTAHDGPAALALAAAWRPEVVLLDIGLPGMDGHEVARRLGEQPWRKSMRLIALTGRGQSSDRDLSAQAGFDAHLVKPVDLDRLLELLDALPPPGG